MKRILFIAIICFITSLLYSCKKDPLDIPIGTIKVDIGGVEKPFSINAKATRLNVSGGYGIQIQGYFKTSSTTNLRFSIVSPNPISNSSYTENAAGNPLIIMNHCVEVLLPCLFQSSTYGSVSNPVSITIAEITGTYVKGTFKGDLQSSGAGSSSTIEVFKNGVFYVGF